MSQLSTGLYIGARHVYIAQVKGTLFGPRLLKYGKAQIISADKINQSSPEWEEAVVAAIKRVLQENNIAARRVNTAISGKDAIIRYFQMPKIPKFEWATAVQFEAKKYIPFKIEELWWGFHVVLPKTKDNQMDVTFVGVKKEIAERRIAVLEKAGLKVKVLEPAPFSMMRLSVLNKQLISEKPTAIIDIDYGLADINIVKNKICYLTRDISLPVEEELIFDNLFNEVRLSLDYYEKLFPSETVNNILLCGQVDLKDWDRRLSEGLRVSVAKIDLVKAIKIKKVLPSLSLSVPIGLALRDLTNVAREINLCQAQKVRSKAAARVKESLEFTYPVRRVLIRTLTLSCIGLLILYGGMYYRISLQQRRLEEMKSLRPEDVSLAYSAATIEEVQKEVQSRVASLDLMIDKRVFWTIKFNEIPKLLPEGVWLTDLVCSEELQGNKRIFRNLTIRGMAYHENPVQEIGVITNFIAQLKENKEFSRGIEQITLESMVADELEGRPIRYFTITCSSQ